MSTALLTMTEAIKAVPVSESTLRRDIRSGKVSFETDARGRKGFMPAELQRVYGDLNLPQQETPQTATDTPQNPPVPATDTPKVVALLEAQVEDLKEQLAQAHDREQALIAQASETTQLAKGLHAQNERLMLPPPEPHAEPEPQRPIRSWVHRLFGIEPTA